MGCAEWTSRSCLGNSNRITPVVFLLTRDVQASIESNGRIDKQQAYALATTNLEKLLGVVNLPDGAADLVAYQGGSLFDLSSKVVGVLSAERGGVDLF